MFPNLPDAFIFRLFFLFIISQLIGYRYKKGIESEPETAEKGIESEVLFLE